MYKVTRILFSIVGIIFPILVGLLHTYAHFTDLVKPEVKESLQWELIVTGETQIAWNTWGVISVMMGISFITIGLINIALMSKVKPNEHPPLMAIFAMFVYLIAVLYVGSEFNAVKQFYGGIFGMTLLIVCSFLTLKSSRN